VASERSEGEYPDIRESKMKLESKLNHNRVKKIREKLLLSKSELARKAGVSPLTIVRIEKGMGCRMETKRKIISALGYDLSDKDKIFTSINAIP
jgi:DNA-binding XRE family transcriptional regulator